MPNINELYAFIERADTIQKAVIAERWFKERRAEFSAHTFDELMRALDHRMKEIFRENWRKMNAYEESLILVSKSTGEVIAEL